MPSSLGGMKREREREEKSPQRPLRALDGYVAGGQKASRETESEKARPELGPVAPKGFGILE